MNEAPHVMILASAGSGKTYALTNRFVALLAAGAPPERIVALTFTRKAAGEFFDEILHKLAAAARDEQTARRLAGDIGFPALGAEDFRRLLRAMVDAMPRLRLGTLDSFFARIARLFPFELGLSGSFELLEEHAARLERQRVLRRMFARVGELDEAQRDFIEAFKRATFGAEEKQLGPRLDRFLDEHHERYLEASGGELWGDPGRIWPDGNEWLEHAADVGAASSALRVWMGGADIGDRQRERWENFVAAAESWFPGMELPDPLTYVLKKVLAAWPAIRNGKATLEFDRKKQLLTADACAALAAIARHVVGSELRRYLATTRGIHAVIRSYEKVYHDAVRRAGKLTFGDVQRLLVPGGGVGLLTSESAGEGRLFIDYRLDAEIDHWLLDEFQDTSHGQWSVLRNLVDEVVQDPSGARTFFCVGDVKQAIFTWREGDPRLFRDIFNHYNAGSPGTVAERHLLASWRSGPPIVELVNAVFGSAPVIADLFPGMAAETWNGEWRAHTSAVPERGGHAAVLVAQDEFERWQRVIELLLEIRPLDRGLTCAVLVRTNANATELADYIRREAGMPATADSDLHVCSDNPLGAALLALLLAAAHPADALAWEQVQMTPLAEALRAEGLDTREAATTRLLRQIHLGGFEQTVTYWLRRVEAGLAADDVFSRVRSRQFVAAAARYDQTGSRDVAEFVQFMERHVVRDPESAASVRVMTIHKSKGLGFDVVIAPDLQGKRLDLAREGLAVRRDSDRSVAWILDLPPRLFCEADEVLTQHLRDAESAACYEALSLLYVAFTRAKRGMYAVVEVDPKSVSRNYPKLLAETLGDRVRDVAVGALVRPGIWAAGDGAWFSTVEAQAAPLPAAPAAEPLVENQEVVRGLRFPARRASGDAAVTLPAGRLFALDEDASSEAGQRAHRLLATVEWVRAAEVSQMAQSWRSAGEPEETVALVSACLVEPELGAIWRRPAGNVTVWRERAFEVVLDGAWVTGVFDRVVVERGGDGAPVGAVVVDYKTDAVPSEPALRSAVARHTPQMETYRRAAAVLLGVEETLVRTELVFLAARRRVEVQP